MRIDGLQNILDFVKFMRETKDYIKKNDITKELKYGSVKTIRTYKKILIELGDISFENKRGAAPNAGIKMIEKSRLKKYELVEIEYALSEKLEDKNEVKRLMEKINIMNDKVF